MCKFEINNVNGILEDLDITHGFDISHKYTEDISCAEIISNFDDRAYSCVPVEWCDAWKSERLKQDFGGDSVLISCLDSVRSFVFGSQLIVILTYIYTL